MNTNVQNLTLEAIRQLRLSDLYYGALKLLCVTAVQLVARDQAITSALVNGILYTHWRLLAS